MFTVAKQCIKLGSSTGLHQVLYTHPAVKAGAGVVGSQPPAGHITTVLRSDWPQKMAVPETRQLGNSGTAVLLAQGSVFVGDVTMVRCRQILGREVRVH